MSSLAAQKATTAAFVAGYNAWDIDAILETWAPDCVQLVLPVSLGREQRTKEEYRVNFTEKIQPLFKNFTVQLPCATFR